MVTIERREALLKSAQQWRDYSASCTDGIGAKAASKAAISLEKEADDGIARCSCCQSPFRQHAGIVQ